MKTKRKFNDINKHWLDHYTIKDFIDLSNIWVNESWELFHDESWFLKLNKKETNYIFFNLLKSNWLCFSWFTWSKFEDFLKLEKFKEDFERRLKDFVNKKRIKYVFSTYWNEPEEFNIYLENLIENELWLYLIYIKDWVDVALWDETIIEWNSIYIDFRFQEDHLNNLNEVFNIYESQWNSEVYDVYSTLLTVSNKEFNSLSKNTIRLKEYLHLFKRLFHRWTIWSKDIHMIEDEKDLLFQFQWKYNECIWLFMNYKRRTYDFLLKDFDNKLCLEKYKDFKDFWEIDNNSINSINN